MIWYNTFIFPELPLCNGFRFEKSVLKSSTSISINLCLLHLTYWLGMDIELMTNFDRYKPQKRCMCFISIENWRKKCLFCFHSKMVHSLFQTSSFFVQLFGPSTEKKRIKFLKKLCRKNYQHDYLPALHECDHFPFLYLMKCRIYNNFAYVK